jgi:hypothetical protein
MVEIVKCQSDLFEKHASVSTRIEKVKKKKKRKKRNIGHIFNTGI